MTDHDPAVSVVLPPAERPDIGVAGCLVEFGGDAREAQGYALHVEDRRRRRARRAGPDSRELGARGFRLGRDFLPAA